MGPSRCGGDKLQLSPVSIILICLSSGPLPPTFLDEQVCAVLFEAGLSRAELQDDQPKYSCGNQL